MFWAMLPGMVPNIFISYSHRDELWRNELVRHLRVWDTSEIQAGANWSAQISENLSRADLAVILVSPDALASDFIVEQELPALIRRQRDGEMVVVPVLLKASQWTAIEGFAELQFANPRRVKIFMRQGSRT
jgi:TIR domain